MGVHFQKWNEHKFFTERRWTCVFWSAARHYAKPNSRQNSELEYPAAVSASAFVSGYRTCALLGPKSQSNLLIEKCAISFSLRVVAIDDFHWDQKAKLDDMMSDGDENIELAMKHTQFLVWLERENPLTKIPEISGQFLIGGNGVFWRFSLNVVKSEFWALQFYDIIPSRRSVDIVHKTLSCVEANCVRRDGLQGILAASSM